MYILIVYKSYPDKIITDTHTHCDTLLQTSGQQPFLSLVFMYPNPVCLCQETLSTLNLGAPGSELSERNKRTIGILRQLFPTLTQVTTPPLHHSTTLHSHKATASDHHPQETDHYDVPPAPVRPSLPPAPHQTVPNQRCCIDAA